jgi:low temperature requirement protein LtrA
LIQGDTLTGPFAGMLSGMVLTIADEHDMTQTGQASALSFDAAGAERRLNEAWLLSTAQRQERGSFRLFSLHLGVTALVSIVLSFDDGQQVWRLGIEHQGVTHSYPRTNPATGDVELVEYVTERDD